MNKEVKKMLIKRKEQLLKQKKKMATAANIDDKKVQNKQIRELKSIERAVWNDFISQSKSKDYDKMSSLNSVWIGDSVYKELSDKLILLRRIPLISDSSAYRYLEK